MGWYVAYLLVVAIHGIMLGVCGITLKNPAYWVLIFCPIASYIFGREHERSGR